MREPHVPYVVWPFAVNTRKSIHWIWKDENFFVAGFPLGAVK